MVPEVGDDAHAPHFLRTHLDDPRFGAVDCSRRVDGWGGGAIAPGGRRLHAVLCAGGRIGNLRRVGLSVAGCQQGRDHQKRE